MKKVICNVLAVALVVSVGVNCKAANPEVFDSQTECTSNHENDFELEFIKLFEDLGLEDVCKKSADEQKENKKTKSTSKTSTKRKILKGATVAVGVAVVAALSVLGYKYYSENGILSLPGFAQYVNNKTQSAFTYVKDSIDPAVTYAKDKLQPAVTYVNGKLQPAATYINGKFQPVVTCVKDKFQPAFAYAKDSLNPAVTYVKNAAQTTMTALGHFLRKLHRNNVAETTVMSQQTTYPSCPQGICITDAVCLRK